jgi:hypothetical protein
MILNYRPAQSTLFSVSLRRLPVTLIAFAALGQGPAAAQSLMVGGGGEASVQRFAGDSTLNRLNGTAAGWAVFGGARLGSLLVRAEGSHEGTIRDLQMTSVIVNGRPVTIRSELSHHTDEVAVLGGYARDLTHRVQVSIVGGVSLMTVHRTFTTNAGELILVSPSTIPPAESTTMLVDRFVRWNVGADSVIRVAHQVGVMAGVRAGPLTLKTDLSGRSVRVVAGVVWQLR